MPRAKQLLNIPQSMTISSKPAKKLQGYDFYKSMGSPQRIVAPMVDQSELAYRQLVRKYGAELCYTPMFHSRLFAENAEYRRKVWSTAPTDRPLLVQFCGNDPDTVVAAAKHVENDCDGIDLNLGCPQGIARKGHYGSFLLEEPALVCSIVKALHENISVPITCKIRLLPDFDKTMELCHGLVEAGCQLLCVHGRTKEMNKHLVAECDWEAIRKIKEALPIPVFANGGIETTDDVERCLKETGVDGVMSSEAILENPGIFSRNIRADGTEATQIEMVQEYLNLVREYPNDNLKTARAHLFKFLFMELSMYTDLRTEMAKADTMEKMQSVVDEVAERVARDSVVFKDRTGWYRRHRVVEEEETADGDELDGFTSLFN